MPRSILGVKTFDDLEVRGNIDLDSDGNIDLATMSVNGTQVLTAQRYLTNIQRLFALESFTTYSQNDFIYVDTLNTSSTGRIDVATPMAITNATDSTSTLTGSIKTAGGLGVAKTIYAAALQVDNLNVDGNTISSTSGAINITATGTNDVVIGTKMRINTSNTNNDTTISNNTNAPITGVRTAVEYDFNDSSDVGNAYVGCDTANVRYFILSSYKPLSGAEPIVTAVVYNNNKVNGGGLFTMNGNFAGSVTCEELIVDNLNVNGNTISSTSGNIAITPLGNNYINPNRLVLENFTTTNRDLIASPLAGQIIYNSTTNKINYYGSGVWNAV